jgi:RNA polymerase sigma-70 factor (sigma-E family)
MSRLSAAIWCRKLLICVNRFRPLVRLIGGRCAMAARTPVPPEGFTEFVAARSATLLRAAWLLTGEQRMAEDLLQTALATTWRRWSTISAADNPVSYVRRILVTTYLSWWRRRWRHEYPACRLPERPADDSDHAAEVAQRDAIRRALARLSRQQRAVVVLRYAEDLSVAQTAQVLGCSPNTVKVQASRALAVLRTDEALRPTEIEETSDEHRVR